MCFLEQNSSLSTAGFVCSLCGFITCGITSIVGLVLCILGLMDSKKEGKSDGIEITGRLGKIDSDLKYINLLSPTDEWDFSGIYCKIKNPETKEIVKTLSKDQTIIVRGKITDVGEYLGYYLDIDEIIPQ